MNKKKKSKTKYLPISLFLIALVIFTIFAVVILITQTYIITYTSPNNIPIGKIDNNNIYRNIYLNPIDLLLKESHKDFIEQAYTYPRFYNPISNNHEFRCFNVNARLLNIQRLCFWIYTNKPIVFNNQKCIIYFNTVQNKIICK